jgi:hypothetical protein
MARRGHQAVDWLFVQHRSIAGDILVNLGRQRTQEEYLLDSIASLSWAWYRVEIKSLAGGDVAYAH